MSYWTQFRELVQIVLREILPHRSQSAAAASLDGRTDDPQSSNHNAVDVERVSCLGEIAKVSRRGSEEFSFEWQIRDFPSLPSDMGDYYFSPEFRTGDETWCLSVWPNWVDEKTNLSSPGCVRIDIMRCDGGPDKNYHVSIGVKGSLGPVMSERIVERECSGYDHIDWDDVYSREHLIEEKTKLLPDDTLTIFCDIKAVVPDVARDACTQTWTPLRMKHSSGKRGQQLRVQCGICCEEPVDCVLYSCGHMCMCHNCAFKIWKSGSSGCPVCRSSIRDVIKVYR